MREPVRRSPLRRRRGLGTLGLGAVAACASLVLVGDLAALGSAGTNPAAPAAQPGVTAAPMVPWRVSVRATPSDPAARTEQSATIEVDAVLGLGDSVPAALACACPSYVTRVAAAIARRQRHPPMVTNEAQSGATSGDLLALVRARRGLASPRGLTIITIGANDFDMSRVTDPTCAPEAALGCYQPALDTLQSNVLSLLALMHPDRTQHGRVLVTGYWNVFLDGAVGRALGPATVRTSDALTRAVNARLAQACRQSGDQYVDLYSAFQRVGDETALLAADGDHPSDAGHALIADLLEDALDGQPGN